MDHVIAICENIFWMKKIILTLIFLLLTQTSYADSIFDDLKKSRKISYLDFILLKIEQKLIQRHALLRGQVMPLRVQYQNIGSQVYFLDKDSKIIISIMGIMDKKRYSQKKYKPKLSDCNILRNILLYGKYGYNLIFQKRNKYLTNTDMEELFISKFLNNLSLSEKEENHITNNTLARVQIIDPVKGNDIFCTGKIAEELR